MGLSAYLYDFFSVVSVLSVVKITPPREHLQGLEHPREFVERKVVETMSRIADKNS